jgi:hypothetical protein
VAAEIGALPLRRDYVVVLHDQLKPQVAAASLVTITRYMRQSLTTLVIMFGRMIDD